MKKFILTSSITFFTILSTLCPVYSMEEQDKKFIDVTETNEAYESVNLIVNKYKIISGFDDNTFRGDNFVDRYMYSVILYNTIEILNQKMIEIEQDILLDISPTINNTSLEMRNISDLDKNHWSYSKVSNLLRLGFIRPFSDNTFRGSSNVNYIGFAIGLGRVMDIINDNAPPVLKRKWRKEMDFSIKPIKEIPPSNPVYAPFKLAIENNLIDYKPELSYLTKDITRYESSIYLVRLINKLEELRKYIIFTKIG